MHPRPCSPLFTAAWLGVVALLLYLLTWSGMSYSMDELSPLSVRETLATGGGWPS